MSTPCQLFFLYDSTLDTLEAGLNRQDRWSPPEPPPQTSMDRSEHHRSIRNECWLSHPTPGPMWLP